MFTLFNRPYVPLLHIGNIVSYCFCQTHRNWVILRDPGSTTLIVHVVPATCDSMDTTFLKITY